MISEELAYGCSGVQTAMEANGLAVRGPLMCVKFECFFIIFSAFHSNFITLHRTDVSFVPLFGLLTIAGDACDSLRQRRAKEEVPGQNDGRAPDGGMIS